MAEGNKNYYQILGVKPGADPKAIKKAYRELARQYHPDANPGDKTAETRFKDINTAYELLYDDHLRPLYAKLIERLEQSGLSHGDVFDQNGKTVDGIVNQRSVSVEEILNLDIEDSFGTVANIASRRKKQNNTQTTSPSHTNNTKTPAQQFEQAFNTKSSPDQKTPAQQFEQMFSGHTNSPNGEEQSEQTQQSTTSTPSTPHTEPEADLQQTTTDQVQEPAAPAEQVEDPLVDYWEQEIDPNSPNWTFKFDGTTLSETEKPVVEDPWEFELLEQVVAEEANTQAEEDPAAASPVEQSVPFTVASAAAPAPAPTPPPAPPTPPAPAPSPAVTGAFASSVTLEGESLPSSETTRSRAGTGAGLAGTAAAAFAADALTGAVPQAAYQPSPSPPPPAPAQVAAANPSSSTPPPGIANSPPQVAPALTAPAQPSLSEQSTATRPDFTPVVQACANLMGTTIRGIVSTVWSTMCDLIDPNIGGGQSFDTTCKQVFEATKATGEALYSFFQATRQYHAQLARAR